MKNTKKFILFAIFTSVICLSLQSCAGKDAMRTLGAKESSPVEDSHNLKRFIKAQTPEQLRVVENALRIGDKKSHWIWYIFPQIEGLGKSSKSHYYGIKSLDEAQAYLADPYLHGNLMRHTQLVLKHKGSKTLQKIFGTPLDAVKFISSMTLGNAADPSEIVFIEALNAFNGGKPCRETLRLLGH
jgi:uncharacterized protein (DUF1810 family)